MAECATAGTRGRCRSGAVGPVRSILPFAISKFFVVSSETLLLPYHKYGRQVNRNEAAVGVQNGLPVGIIGNVNAAISKPKIEPIQEVAWDVEIICNQNHTK